MAKKLQKMSGFRAVAVVYLVLKRHENEGESIYAVCRSEEVAENARIRLAAILGEGMLHFEIVEVVRDSVHPFGILVQDSSVDIE